MVPNIPNNASLTEIKVLLQELTRRVRDMEDRLPDNTEGWAGGVTNLTELRSLDASSASASDVRSFVATLANDLVNAGLLR